MNKSLNFSKKYILFALFAILQLFFIEHYRTDKTILASQITESMFANNTIFGIDIPCNGWGDTPAGSNKTWAEEPPVYHILGLSFHFLGLGDLSYALYPLICFFLLAHSLLLIMNHFNLMSNYSHWWKQGLVLFLPFIFIHSHRPLPDNLSVAFLGYFIYFFYKDRKSIALLFATLAVTTKALAIFAIFPLCLGDWLTHKDKKKAFLVNLTFGLSIVPTLLWFYFLSKNSISNPFFPIGSLDVQHTGGMNFVDLTTRKYWSRIFSWTAVKGVGVFVFLTAVISAFKVKDDSRIFKLTLFGMAGHILYVLMIRGPQRSAPWYSFYFLPFYLIMFSFWAGQVKKKVWAQVIIAINIIMSLTFVRYSLDISRNLIVHKIGESGVPCNFHQWIYEKHKSEGRL